jgi:hypothetical protein
MHKECPKFTPPPSRLGPLLEELIETSPVALAKMLLDLGLTIQDAPQAPYFKIGQGRG